jgi:hypothetical protein
MTSPASTRARHRGTAALAAAVILTSLAVAAATPAAARPAVRTISCTPAATPPIQGSGLGDTAEGFLLDKGRFTRIAREGATETVPFGVNDRLQVVGGYTEPDGTGQGFKLDRGRFVKIDFPGAMATLPTAINDSGRIVGCDAPSGTRLGWARWVLAARVALIVTGRPGTSG